jgi:hypothetical protein
MARVENLRKESTQSRIITALASCRLALEVQQDVFGLWMT